VGSSTWILVQDIDPAQASELATKCVVAMCVGQIAYYSRVLPAALGFRAVDHPAQGRGPEVGRSKLTIVSIACLSIFVLAYGVFQVRVGGSIFDVTRLAEGKAVWRSDPTLSWMMRGVQIGFLPLFIILIHLVTRVRLRTLILIGAASFAIAIMVLRLGQRGIVAFSLLCSLIIVHYMRRRIPMAVFVAALFIGTTLSNILLPYRATYLRTPEMEGPGLLEVAQQPAAVVADHEAERQRFSSLAVVFQHFPERHDYLLGRSWLALLVSPVPRWLWPEKGEYFRWRDSAIVWNLVGAPMPTSYVGALYANFSWLGICLGMLDLRRDPLGVLRLAAAPPQGSERGPPLRHAARSLRADDAPDLGGDAVRDPRVADHPLRGAALADPQRPRRSPSLLADQAGELVGDAGVAPGVGMAVAHHDGSRVSARPRRRRSGSPRSGPRRACRGSGR
jgi:hypothetical protein